MLDPSLSNFGLGNFGLGNFGLGKLRSGRYFDRVPPSERMDHPAVPPISCQTSVRSACRHTKSIATAVSPGPLPPAGRPRVQTGPMTAEQENQLPPELAAALAAFERHLRAERSL